MRELIQETGGKNQAVTYAVVWRIRSDSIAAFERMLPEIVHAAAQFPGHLTTHILSPSPGGELIYRVMAQFDSDKHFRAWRDSAECRLWVAKAQELAASIPDVQVRSGLEAWFRDPEAKQPAPATYKTAILMWAVLFPLTLFFRWIFSVLSVPFSPLVQTGMLMAIEIMLTSYLLMPQLARIFRFWLYPNKQNGNVTRAILWLLLVGVSFTRLSLSQQTSDVFQPHAPLPYTPLVYDQDWSYLSNSRNIQDYSDHLHFVQIGHDPADYIDFTGQARERGEYFDHPAWGAQPPDNGYLLQRYLFSADLHVHDSFRLFCQLTSSLINGRNGGPRPAIDEQTLSSNQCFFDLQLFHRDKRSLTIRAGRQLIALGSTRLVAIGAGLNVEQPFDGARLVWEAGGWELQGLAARPVAIHNGIFASPPDHAQELWGVYATHAIPLPKAKLDAYYLGYDHASGVWTQGAGHEQRETVGARVYARSPSWYYDWEYAYQFGRFGSGKIRAWSMGTNTGYSFRDSRFAPRVELDAGAISGDHDLHDKTLGTFNSLFPNGSYLSQAVLIGPFNLVIARPKLELHLTKRLTFSPNLEFLWRESTTDGIYGAIGYPTHSGTASSARYVGEQADTEIDWNLSRHIIFSVDYVHFFPGAYLKQSPPGREVNFIAPQIAYNF